MLSFERHSKKNIELVSVYRDANAMRPEGTVFFVSKHKGKSLIEHEKPADVLIDDALFLRKKYNLTKSEWNELVGLAAKDAEMDPDTDRSIKRAYLDIRTRLQKKMKRELVFDQDEGVHLRPVYDTSTPRRNYIYSFFGSSGSGKSFAVCQTILRDPAVVHYQQITLIGTVGAEDPSYQPLRDKYIEKFRFVNTSDLTQADLDVKSHKFCAVILDDIDSEPDPKTRRRVQLFRDQLLQTARHYSVRVILTSHRFNSYQETSKMRNSSLYIGIFARSIQHTLIQILNKEYNYSMADADRLTQLCKRDGRLVTIRRQHPVALITPKRVILL
jgi:hypothetical protein